MRVLRIAVALLVAVCALSACGGDDDDDDDAAPTSSSGSNEFVDEDEYLEVLTASFADDGFDATEAEARCAAERVVDELGADRLQEAGLTVERLEDDEEDSGPTDLTEAESETVADALFECLDIAAAFAEGFAADGEATEAEAECVSERAAELPEFRSFVAWLIRVGDSVVMETDEAEEFADVLLECMNFGPSFAEGFGQELTPDQEECVNGVLRESDVFRQYMVDSLSGEVVDELALGEQLVPEISGCLPNGGADIGPA